MLSTFSPFLRLPTELRILIWKHAAEQPYELHERRVIRINHDFPPGVSVSRDSIQEELPGLVAACRESREVALRSYTGVFDYSSPKWILTIGSNMTEIPTIMEALGLPDVSETRPRGGTLLLTSNILVYMNEHRAERDRDPLFSTFGEKIMPIGPRWFNPDHDIILLKPASDKGYHWAIALWFHFNLEAHQMKHLAFELPHLYNRIQNLLQCRVRLFGPLVAPLHHLNAVESVTLLYMQANEVVILTRDSQLAPETWLFHVDIESLAFKNQMGDNWAGVTWRVKLPHSAGARKHLWRAVECWMPDMRRWEHQKYEICKAESGTSPKWFAVHQDLPRELCPLILSYDGKSYIGPTSVN